MDIPGRCHLERGAFIRLLNGSSGEQVAAPVTIEENDD